MSGHKKSIIKESLERLDRLMAVGESRFAAKQAARHEAEAEGTPFWTYTSGRMHSHRTRQTYQQQVFLFVNWARAHAHLPHLADLDARADELASQYLVELVARGRSPYTLRTIRSALRLFFGDRGLAASVALPPRRREGITRSRFPAARDRQVQLANWQDVILFAKATGLRKEELRYTRVRDVYRDREGRLVVRVPKGKGGKFREAPVLPALAEEVLALVAGRVVSERLFARLPDIDIHALRRQYAQALYLAYAPGWSLPPASGVLHPSLYHREAALLVSAALGHARLEIILSHYLR
jgi:integrase